MYLRNRDIQVNNVSTLKFLTEEESYIPPYSIPIFESSTFHDNFVNYQDIVNYSNLYESDIHRSYSKICESNNVNHLLVCINEEDMYTTDVYDYFNESQVIIRPISKKSSLYKQLSEACEDYMLGDEYVLDNLLEAEVSLSSDQLEDIRMGRKTPDSLLSNTDKRFFKLVQDHLKDVDSNVDYTKKVTKTTIKTDDKGKSFSMSTYSKDRNFLGRAVASLRSIYRNWLQKYNMEQDPKKKTMIKSLLAKIMNFIDRIMVKLQNKLS